MTASEIDYFLDLPAAGEEIKYADRHVQASLCLVPHEGALLVTWAHVWLEKQGGGGCRIDGDTYQNRDAGIRAFRTSVRSHISEVQHWDIADPRFAGLLAWMDEQCGEGRGAQQGELF